MTIILNAVFEYVFLLTVDMFIVCNTEITRIVPLILCQFGLSPCACLSMLIIQV